MIDELTAQLIAGGVDAAQAGREARALLDAAGGDAQAARELGARRLGGTPLAYLVGRQPFLGVELLAAPGALVPRAETELLGRAALARIADGARIIDMCCGSGNLACALAHARPAARVWASDLTDGCVTLARRNADHVGAAARITVVKGDLFAPLGGLGLEGTIDAVVCNPPYISTGRLEKDRAALLAHEPREAFDGGPYGLSIHQRVIKDALPFLVAGGWLMFEIGAGQERQLELLFARARAYEPIERVDDATGQVRAVLAKKK